MVDPADIFSCVLMYTAPLVPIIKLPTILVLELLIIGPTIYVDGLTLIVPIFFSPVLKALDPTVSAIETI